MFIQNAININFDYGSLHRIPVDGLTYRGTPELGGELRNTSVRCNLTTRRLPHHFHQRPPTQPSMRLFLIISVTS
jgi:hypothetical protein